MLQLGLSGQMFDDMSVWDHLESAVEFGYTSVELRSTHVSPSISREELDIINLFLEENSLKVNALSCFIGNYGLLSDEECNKAFETFKDYVRLACNINADMIRVWPGWQESKTAPIEVWEKAARWMAKSGDYAGQFGKKIVMEIHHGTLCDTADSSLKLLNMIDRENVGVTFEPVNMYQVPTDYGREAINKLGKHIFNVHIKDIVQLSSPDYQYSFAYSYYAKHIGRFTKVAPPSGQEERYYCHRRINNGGIDWATVFKGLEEIGYQGRVIVESVSEANKDMPQGRALAKACLQDAKTVQGSIQHDKWCVSSTCKDGLNEIISPQKSPCSRVRIYRLNLNKGQSYTLSSCDLEMNPVLIKGKAQIMSNMLSEEMNKLDSFYIPGQTEIKIRANEDCVFYIGAAPCKGVGEECFRKYDPDLEDDTINQVHGEGIYERKVFFTLNPEVSASHLICGITWGKPGAWTSWPPHQHENHLEEVYCYFDMPEPGFGFHMSYTEAGKPIAGSIHIVREGDMVLAPKGYHPTVASPFNGNIYLWVLASFTPDSRRYDLAELDPSFENRGRRGCYYVNTK